MITDQKDFEYLVGVIQGDGNVRKDHNLVRISIHAEEQKFLRTIYKLGAKTFKVKPTIHTEKDGTMKILHFKSKKLTRLISQYKDSTTGLWSMPKKLIYPEKWLAGVWDTDGYAKFKDGRLDCVFSQKSNGNIEFVKTALEEIGISRYNVSTFDDERWEELTKTDYLRIWSIDTEVFANKIKLKFPKKKQALEAALDHGEFYAYRPRGDFKKEILEIIMSETDLSNKELAEKLETSGNQITQKLAELFDEGEISKTKKNDSWNLNDNLIIEEW